MTQPNRQSWFLALADATEVWVHIVSKAKVHYHGKVFDLDADTDDVANGKLTWATASSSLEEWVAVYEPSLLRMHFDTGTSYGHIVKGQSRILTVDEQAERGITNPTATGFFAKVRFKGEKTIQEFKNGQLAFSSPLLGLGQTDDAGRVWPCNFTELSLAGNPHQTSHQISIRDMAGIALSEKGKNVKIKLGPELSGLMMRAIEGMVDEETTRADVISKIAEASGIEEGTVNAIVSGEIDCPPIDRIRGIAQALDLQMDTVAEAAVADGCEFEEGEEAAMADHPEGHIDDPVDEEKLAMAAKIKTFEAQERVRTDLVGKPHLAHMSAALITLAAGGHEDAYKAALAVVAIAATTPERARQVAALSTRLSGTSEVAGGTKPAEQKDNVYALANKNARLNGTTFRTELSKLNERDAS